jgi:ribosome maturation factor RimP
MRYFEELREKIEEYLTPVIRFEGYELIDLNFINQGGKLFLKILINKPGGITMQECAQMNRKIGRLLDKADFLNQSYILEVSSPGIDRPLKEEKEFRCAVGRDVIIWMKDGSVYKGNLIEAREGKVLLACEDGVKELSLSEIKKGQQQIKLPEE